MTKKGQNNSCYFFEIVIDQESKDTNTFMIGVARDAGEYLNKDNHYN